MSLSFGRPLLLAPWHLYKRAESVYGSMPSHANSFQLTKRRGSCSPSALGGRLTR
jgi:hypothetical protein